MNTRNKMYRTNSAIKKEMFKLGFKDIYLFPHSRFMKDYIFEEMGFDAMAFRKDEKIIYLFQFKSNKKPSKAILKQYEKVAQEYCVKCVWATKFDRGEVKFYGL